MARIWDAFLTDRDKAHLAARGARPREVRWGKRPALLLIDNYYGVLGTRPMPILEQIKELPGAVGEDGWQAVHKTKEILDVARELEIPVVHITGLGGLPGWGARRSGSGRRPLSPDLVAAGKDAYDIVEELAPIEGEVVLRKSSPSAFWGTPLVGHLNFLGVDTVVACGESTSGCVRASVVEGCTYRFNMIVPEECVYDRHQASHALNLFDLNQKYADVIPLADAIAGLKAWKSAQESAVAERVLASASV